MNTLDDYHREITKLDKLIGGTELSKIDNVPAAKQLVRVKKMIQDDNICLNNPISSESDKSLPLLENDAKSIDLMLFRIGSPYGVYNI